MIKRFLIGTSALIAVGTLAGAAQAADPIKLSVGGKMNQWLSFADVKDKVTTKYNHVAVNSDTEVHFKGETVLDNGLKVEVVIEHEAERTDATARNANQQYAQLSGGWGALRIGETMNAANRVHNQAPGAGAGMGDAITILGIQPVSGTVTSMTDGQTSVDGIASVGISATSIDYVSPMFGPFAFGLTYTPHGGNRGLAVEGNSIKDLMGVAFVYADKWGPVAVNADVAWARADHETVGTQNGMLHGIPVGVKFGFAGFEVGGSYFRIMDNVKALRSAANANAATSFDGVAWDAGISYTMGDWKLGYTYFTSKHEGDVDTKTKDTAKVHNAGVAYTMGPGVSVSANGVYTAFADEAVVATTATHKSRTYGLITGIQLTF
ncbi:MAG: porin [Alphaproteobacteria bacterium]|nr:porin [Alphaproteobacteria bacterium]